MSGLPQAIWEGEFIVFGQPIKCAVLDDGRRVIEHSNARLIAAAPDLLAACEASINAIARFAETGVIRADERSTTLQAAITKARGQ